MYGCFYVDRLTEVSGQQGIRGQCGARACSVVPYISPDGRGGSHGARRSRGNTGRLLQFTVQAEPKIGVGQHERSEAILRASLHACNITMVCIQARKER